MPRGVLILVLFLDLVVTRLLHAFASFFSLLTIWTESAAIFGSMDWRRSLFLENPSAGAYRLAAIGAISCIQFTSVFCVFSCLRLGDVAVSGADLQLAGHRGADARGRYDLCAIPINEALFVFGADSSFLSALCSTFCYSVVHVRHIPCYRCCFCCTRRLNFNYR